MSRHFEAVRLAIDSYTPILVRSLEAYITTCEDTARTQGRAEGRGEAIKKICPRCYANWDDGKAR